MAARELVVHLAVGAHPVVGLWCQPCALPSRFEVDVVTLSTDGVTPIGTINACTDCGTVSGAFRRRWGVPP